MRMTCTCHIVPKDVLERLASDKKLSAELRKAARDSARMSDGLRALRTQAAALTQLAHEAGSHLVQLAIAPKITVYDCKHTQTLPGAPIASPGASKDATAKRCFAETTDVAKFYKTVFGRNSIDDAGMTMMSSIHYGRNYNNAMWNGSQMLYGDGDGKLFTDFTGGNDVIGHELTHGVTQHSLQLAYSGDAGGLNESLSDCFGSMFRQWEAGQDVTAADWLIGADIMGPAAKAKGYKALRNMAKPDDKAALAAQPTRYSQITPGMDPHYSSGPPNLAFCTACKTLGGKSWEKIGQVWYAALTTSGAQPNMTMPQFAARTRQLAAQNYAAQPTVAAAVDAGWKTVGL
ncbi:M4 family metallopeptidase [Roseateles saccharophilus]|uniref:Neutral metalloproteinase n=1 Tax=Roseateles saccharophilus TaxID=304 RepID=A0A4V2VSD8_ROSSA|nr:M4 family metallopeptidase [Roseateles saccharophilus]TCV02050.1 thermolysin metallopeptidase-like protein [Roseateles saccharophilus]